MVHAITCVCVYGKRCGPGAVCVRASVVLAAAGGAAARVAGKMGGYSNKMGGKSTSGINEEIIWISISMAIAIAVLIALALCYILKENYALADSVSDLDITPYALYPHPQLAADEEQYFYNFNRFSYLRDSFRLPQRHRQLQTKQDVYIHA
ncbi:hypothetical protein EVAR_74994_1 [Eumeta japonica]|uniref:Uncharacterized protein n=1 Tax=Eumeta variegata TaxID=151549 RepID=A0A4C1VAQ4_EUMVA|nr:hypothetical protein EVAR_74994_1 [Eumeta japonica]